MATVTSLAREWQMPPEQLTLQLIGRRIGGSVAEHCRQRQDGLNHTLEAIQQANAVNRTVVTRSLDLLHDTLRLMRRHVEPPAVYSSSATPVGSLSGGAVIEREG
jgi:flagellar biosynthesis/type III secretory pathway chaperone